MHSIDADSIERTFNFMDRDRSGFIDRAELVKIVGYENEDVVNYILDVQDINKDGKLEFSEFREIMTDGCDNLEKSL